MDIKKIDASPITSSEKKLFATYTNAACMAVQGPTQEMIQEKQSKEEAQSQAREQALVIAASLAALTLLTAYCVFCCKGNK